MSAPHHDAFERAHEELGHELPDRMARAFQRLRQRRARLLRIPLGVLLVVGGVLSFLPVLGLWMLPVGLLLLAEDLPFLRKPVGRVMLWVIERFRSFRARRRARRRASTPGSS